MKLILIPVMFVLVVAGFTAVFYAIGGYSTTDINNELESDVNTDTDATQDTINNFFKEEEAISNPEPNTQNISPVIVGPQRNTGKPGGGNGASSFHLWWSPPTLSLKEVSVVLKIENEPDINELYFWALQASFYDINGETSGGAHTGLQWHPNSNGIPFKTINWGGYDGNGQVLSGSESSLAPKTNDPSDPNTKNFNWSAGREYKFRIYETPGVVGAWRAEVQDLSTGKTQVIRDLYGGGDFLGSIAVWSEVFAACDDPSVSVTWSDFTGVTESGSSIDYSAATVNYQTYDNGGCTNTNSYAVSNGIRQTTNTTRTTPQASALSF